MPLCYCLQRRRYVRKLYCIYERPSTFSFIAVVHLVRRRASSGIGRLVVEYVSFGRKARKLGLEYGWDVVFGFGCCYGGGGLV
jgi:hypothetical protein